MDNALIQRYQRGGDIYNSLASQFGTAGADAIAQAALSGDETQINAALVTVKRGAPLNTSTLSIFGNQLVTDPFAAPLEGANKLVGNSVLSFLKSPWVVAVVVVVAFSLMGGWGWVGRKLFGSK